MRIGFLGPEGTFSHQALIAAAPSPALEAVAVPTIHAAVLAVRDGVVDLAVVPIENALEGSVDVTLDTLAVESDAVTIVGELVQPIRNCLIAAAPGELSSITTLQSHPQPLGQCQRFLRETLPAVEVVLVSSTAEAVRAVAAAGDSGQAALGNRLAAELYDAHILRADVDDEPDNVTRFVWLATDERASELRALVERGGTAKTSIVFWGGGDEAPGWLVSCLAELSERDITLTRIESRPRRVGLGHYMFFADLLGSIGDPTLAAAVDALGAHCEEVRVLGSYLAP